MLAMMSFGGETLLLPAIATTVVGAGLVLLLLQRSAGLATERDGLAALVGAFRALEVRHDEVATVLDRLPDPVVQRDREGRILLANQSFERLLIESGARPDNIFAEPAIGERRAAATLPGGARRTEEAVRTPAGTRWFSWTEVDIEAEDGSVSCLRTGREITSQIANERALEEARIKAEGASEAKSRFLATVSHEFRTPLNGILGMADLLLGTPLQPEQTAYVQALRGSAENFLSLIEEILDFSTIEAGRLDLREEPFEIETVVQGVVELLAPRAQDKGVEIAAYVARDVPVRVASDRDRLRQVLFNLAGNAVKFTEAGGVGLTVERGQGDEVVFAVTDTGLGIPAERLGLVFEEFEQAGLQATRGAGTGLGLAITRRIVERMGGRIEVESEPGRGSVFRVRLPMKADAEPRPASLLPDLQGRRVLLVGASPFGMPAIGRVLQDRGATISSEAEPGLASRRLKSERFDALLADAALGETALRMVAGAAREAGVAHTIVLLSPFERRDLGSPHVAGFDGYLMKPVRSRSLLQRFEAPAAALPSEAPALPDTTRDATLRRVLLAEDDPVNALVASTILRKLGALVDWAKDGTEALRFAEEALSGVRPAYDLLLLDMRMPGLDGREVARRVREREAATPRHDRCRIVALTASLIGGHERYRDTAGFDAFLLKPVRPEALARELSPASDAAFAA